MSDVSHRQLVAFCASPIGHRSDFWGLNAGHAKRWLLVDNRFAQLKVVQLPHNQ
jgi:hypothetical protein